MKWMYFSITLIQLVILSHHVCARPNVTQGDHPIVNITESEAAPQTNHQNDTINTLSSATSTASASDNPSKERRYINLSVEHNNNNNITSTKSMIEEYELSNNYILNNFLKSSIPDLKQNRFKNIVDSLENSTPRQTVYEFVNSSEPEKKQIYQPYYESTVSNFPNRYYEYDIDHNNKDDKLFFNNEYGNIVIDQKPASIVVHQPSDTFNKFQLFATGPPPNVNKHKIQTTTARPKVTRLTKKPPPKGTHIFISSANFHDPNDPDPISEQEKNTNFNFDDPYNAIGPPLNPEPFPVFPERPPYLPELPNTFPQPLPPNYFPPPLLPYPIPTPNAIPLTPISPPVNPLPPINPPLPPPVTPDLCPPGTFFNSLNNACDPSGFVPPTLNGNKNHNSPNTESVITLSSAQLPSINNLLNAFPIKAGQPNKKRKKQKRRKKPAVAEGGGGGIIGTGGGDDSEFGIKAILHKMLKALPLVLLFNPLSFGFWAFLLSPLLLAVATGTALAMFLYPWAMSPQSRKTKPTLVIHRHKGGRPKPSWVRPKPPPWAPKPQVYGVPWTVQPRNPIFLHRQKRQFNYNDSVMFLNFLNFQKTFRDKFHIRPS